MNVKTLRRHESLLEELRIVQRLEPWHSNRVSRLTKAPKRYLVDPGPTATLLGVDGTGVRSDGDLLGRMLESLVIAQLRPLLGLRSGEIRGQHDGRHEIDVLLESADGGVVGIEVKATAAPTAGDARHLIWLRDQLGARFAAGVVLHAGPGSFELADRIFALPIAVLGAAGG